MEQYNFQNCQKIVVFSKDLSKVLLCQRKGEEDYDGVYSFIGGKMETSDPSLLEGLKREKDEEVGEEFKIKIYPKYSVNYLYRKKQGQSMILPHYFAVFEEGDINLNEEYSEFQWVSVERLKDFEPKIENIPQTVQEILRLSKIFEDTDFELI